FSGSQLYHASGSTSIGVPECSDFYEAVAAARARAGILKPKPLVFYCGLSTFPSAGGICASAGGCLLMSRGVYRLGSPTSSGRSRGSGGEIEVWLRTAAGEPYEYYDGASSRLE